MEKDKIFFSEQGLTSTSANHISNLAKEYYTDLEEQLNFGSFYTTTVALVGKQDIHIVETGVQPEFLNQIKDSLEDIASAKSLIAWLREALKAKDNLQKEINLLSEEEVADILHLVLPKMPEKEKPISVDDYFATLNIKERNRYYYLETLCAVYGTYIHPKGNLSVKRKKLYDKLNHEYLVSGEGRDALIYHYTPSVNKEDIEETFFNLQAKYREYQAELNGMKHLMELAVSESTDSVNDKYAIATKEYADKLQSIRAEIIRYKTAKLTEIRNLKIRIPDSLKGIYNKINSLGKKK